MKSIMCEYHQSLRIQLGIFFLCGQLLALQNHYFFFSKKGEEGIAVINYYDIEFTE